VALLFLLAMFYLPFFLRSFLCPQHPHVLNVYFGVPGSGKTTFAAYLTRWALHENALIRFCRKHENPVTRVLLNSHFLKRRIDVYSNVPITGAYVLNAREDIGKYMIEDAKVIIDEAGIEYNNRNYKSFPQEAIYSSRSKTARTEDAFLSGILNAISSVFLRSVMVKTAAFVPVFPTMRSISL